VHNIYNPPSTHSETQDTETLRTLEPATQMPGEHVIIGDANLHHPLWAGPSYPMQHRLSDRLISIVRNAKINLILPPGTITRDCQRGSSHEQTTIDLAFASESLCDQLVRCQVESEREQSSDHLPIGTEFEWESEAAYEAPERRRA
jgi:endonuclease/exonuclease/phosphatase family metal-dependent hydrolase